EGEKEPYEISERMRTTTKPGTWIKSSNGRWWYKHDDGTYTKNGWEYIDGKWYHFDPEGWMQTGWLEVDGKWYYLSGSGAMVTGWLKLDGKWYYFKSSGVMVTGWVSVGGKWYFMNSSGVMQTGWKKIDGYWYALDSNTGAMITGWFFDGNQYYYLKKDGKMQSETIKSGNKEERYLFVSSYGETASVNVQCVLKEKSVSDEYGYIGYPYREVSLRYNVEYTSTAGAPSIRNFTIAHVNGSSASSQSVNSFNSVDFTPISVITNYRKNCITGSNKKFVKYANDLTRSLRVNWIVNSGGGYIQPSYSGAYVLRLQ
ncbi:MAG: hypothetical protein ACI4EO_01060, partial [Blautia sp.]